MNIEERNKNFIDRDKLYGLIEGKKPSQTEVDDILNKALKLKGLDLYDVAALLRVEDAKQIHQIMECAKTVKEAIYGKRLVLFAPIYTGNVCMNNCTYCSFRKDNHLIKRKILTMQEIAEETSALLKQGHKRALLICGENNKNGTDYMVEAIRTTYGVRERGGKDYIRRINVELAPMEVEDFARLKAEKIGTYVCFQETYDQVKYSDFHPAGTPKADYLYRLTVMDRAMEGGVDDVGIGALFGLIDYRFEVLAMIEHANHLERCFGCGPHTVSVPRMEPAIGAPTAENIPMPVSDEDFKKLVAIIRIALPYTGIILSTRESDAMRNELIKYGVSQISAASKTNPGSYAHEEEGTGTQFSTGDHRTLEEVIASLVDAGYIPSFCTGCYRKHRVGGDFMDLAKPGLIKQFCLPNAMFTFNEYLQDFASEPLRLKGKELIKSMFAEVGKPDLLPKIEDNLCKIDNGERDIYF
ncbi:MAG: [FeFe] hydrogenase H-cluster radical SAM maturase HydG [Bacteroidales bacterium]|jgi:2-iminoacetate synthase|nr:[FeFe] hydrogenase H-cluster radical SAM maturase HydG [Bacteroidales bacterium]